MKKETLTRLGAYLSIYLLVIARWGYEYGRNDQMQVLGYAKYLADKTLYPFDNYIQGMAEKVPNERFIFSWLMSWTGSMMEVICFIGHAVVSVLMFHLLYKISRRYIETDYLAWLAIVVIFIPLYGINLGGNELYYNTFFVSNVVKLAGLWGIWLFLNEKIIIAFFIIGLSTLLQPVVGVQLFVTLTGMLICTKVIKRSKIEWKTIIQSVLAFLLTGGIWVIFLKLFFEEAAIITNREFFNILFEFRAPHHYLPFDFSLKSYIILVPLMVFGLIYFSKKEQMLAWFFGLSFVLLSGYIILVEGFSVVDVASLQWFKMTIWLKAFSVIALIAFLEKQFPLLKEKYLAEFSRFAVFLFIPGILIVLIFFRSYLPFDVPFDFGKQKTNDPAVEISILAKANTPEDALFIHPIAFTELKVYGERSSYIEWKILVHRKNAIKKWYDRLGEVYSIGLETGKTGFSLYQNADGHFKSLDAEELKKMHETSGITHLITWRDHELALPVIEENAKYRIYSLNQ